MKITEYNDPLYWWKKVKNIFKKPPCKVHIGKYNYLMLCDPIRERKIYFASNGLGYKLKYDSPRFEYIPNILFKFFNWEIRIFWTWGDSLKDTFYWETILDILINKKSLRSAIDDNSWLDNNKTINIESCKMLKKELV